MTAESLGQSVPKLDGIHLMDGIEGLLRLPRHSVDMLLTDPPYGTSEAQRSHPVFRSMPL